MPYNYNRVQPERPKTAAQKARTARFQQEALDRANAERKRREAEEERCRPHLERTIAELDVAMVRTPEEREEALERLRVAEAALALARAALALNAPTKGL
jgi:hypothetical protein